MSFTARYFGTCDEGDTIRPGDEIESAADGGFQHVECAEVPDPAAPAAHEELCTECFIIHPKGACD